MHQHRTVHILLVELLLQICQHHHRELQPLGAVYAHDLHALRRLRGGQARRVALFQQPPQVGDEVEQPRLAALHHLTGVVVQRRQPRLPLGSVGHGPENGHHMAPVVDIPQQLVRRHLPCRTPQLVQQRQKVPRRLSLVPTQCIVIVPLRL